MEREEATSFLKEVIAVCGGINEAAIMLMPPNADDVLSHGYQLHIKMPAPDNMTCIRPVVKKHNLVMSEQAEKGLFVIYRPMEKAENVVQP